VGLRAGLDRCGKSRPPPGFDPRAVQPVGTLRYPAHYPICKRYSSPVTGLERSRKLRFPDFMTTAQDGGKVVSPTHRPDFTPRKYTWYSFLLEVESNPGP
jgi:hypothetical protein